MVIVSRLRRSYRTLITVLLSGGILFLIVGSGVFCAVTCTPSWYVPKVVDQAQLHADKRAAIGLIESISGQLNRGQSADVVIDVEQLGRWITARNELALDWVPQLEGYEHPVVVAAGEVVRIAVARRWGGWRFVASADVGGREVAGGSLLELRRVRIGVLPVPIRWVADGQELQRVGLNSDQPGIWIWPNGKKPFLLANVQLSGDEIKATLVPQ